MNKISKLKKTFLLVSIGVFIFSLTQKSFCVNNDCGEFGSGLLNVIFGWLVLILGGANICWLANPLLIIAWIIPYKNLQLKIILCSISNLLSFSFLFFKEIIKDEAGNYGEITGYALGYWLWFLSNLIYLLGILWISHNENKYKTIN